MDLDTTTLLTALAALLSLFWLRSWSSSKSTIPALDGADGLIASYRSALRVLGHGAELVRRGYTQHRTGVYRMPMLLRWEYVANAPAHIAEIAAAPEDVLSFHLGAAETLQTEWTMGSEIAHNPYHALAVRGSLTRNLARCFPQVQDEIVHAFADVLALEDMEWKLIDVVPTLMQIVARTSNRLFVGLPLCRDKEYLDLNINYTVSVFTRGQIIRLFPEFLKPLVAPLLSSRKSSLRHALKFLGPLIDARLADERAHGPEWAERPNDLISWLLDLATGEERTTPALALRVLITNMAAIHTSSMAARVVESEGWSKAALGSMHRIDSFLRESQRLGGSGPLAMTRKVVARDGFTFADGTHIPHGAFLNTPGHVVNTEPDSYADPETFDGFRFSRLREAVNADADADADAAKEAGPNPNANPTFFNRQMVSTAPDHLVFGHGRHACPGRFFAATELKAMLAYLLLHYDVKAETPGVRPPDDAFAMFRVPNARGRIWVRKRADLNSEA
ncbi:cytochrome P450 [Mycena rosella]|uniref:Cytochrome P450 n=1 Tax=Mycena rosella TaxID=1033263 RepID=A0AAD7BSN5_MYCRO|nr:cytochrome P450 [Mycena rosella]